ncbi:MAG: hypothetical protein JO122_21335 [Acetobacteraceae bacterium]|nr:hypothetical protein [Acetobacteraceae bacterium]
MRTRVGLLTTTFLAGGLGIAAAQQPPAQAPLPPPVARGQPAANVTGTVHHFELTPSGALDGFILNNGMEIHLPPHLTPELAAAVRPGDQVQVRGWQSATPGLVIATSVADARTGQTVVDQGPPAPGTLPPPPPPGQSAPGAQWATVQGRVVQYIHGPQGDINGVLLDNGTELKLPPPAAYQVSVWVQPGQTITAQGYVLSNTFGRVMNVQAVGPSSQNLAQVTWTAPRGPGRPPTGPAQAYAPPPPAPGATPSQ